MPTFLLRLTLIALLGCAVAAPVIAQDDARCILPREHHPWGRFEPESWKRVRVVTETLDPSGAIISRSATETRTTLQKVDNQGFIVQVDVLVEVEGKQFESPSQTVQHGYCGKQDGQQAMYKRVGDATLAVGGQHVPCEKRDVTIVDGGKNRTVTIYYSPEVSPYILRRESTSAEAEGQTTSSVTEVVALDETADILGQQLHVAKLKTTVSQGKTSRVTVETVSDAVPGGVVRHSSQETDEMGRVIRRSTLDLIGYEAVEAPMEQGRPPRRHLFGRRDRAEESRRDDSSRSRSKSN